MDASDELEPFRCEVERDGSAARVRPVGDLDLATTPGVDTQLAELWSAGATRLVLDLRHTRLIDSMGLRLLLTWNAHRWTHEIAFSVVPGPPAVHEVLEMTGVARRLAYSSPDETLD
jgi:anti-anti-sigma factor